MSLINDALKRASQSLRRRPAPGSGDPPLLPVNAPPTSKVPPLAVMSLIAVILFALAGWFIWSDWKAKPVPLKSAATNVAAAKVTPGAGASSQALKLQPPASAGSNAAAAVSPQPGTGSQEEKVAQADSNAVSGVTSPAPVTASIPAPPTNVVSLGPATGEIEPTVDTGTPAPSAAAFPPLNLEGITFRRTNSSVIINGQILYIGDVLKGVRVVAIERQEVTVELEGQRKVLSMP